MMDRTHIARQGKRITIILTASVMFVVPLLAVLPAQAQGGSRAESPTWDDAPLVPRHRSAADWLVDVGWKTFDEVYNGLPLQSYEVGDTERFVPLGGYTPEDFVLTLRTPHAYFWFERGLRVDQPGLEETARFFEDHIFPLNSRLYALAYGPGVDDEPIHVVNQTFIAPGVLGAFNPDDYCPQSLCPDSNQRAIIYLSLDDAPLNSAAYLTTLAHEHQHLVQHHVDGNEQRWFNEGLSQLVEHLNGFAPDVVSDSNITAFLDHPDHHLTGWASVSDQAPYYGAGYLFMVYLYERFGLEFMQQLVTSDYDGLAAVQHTLAATGQAKRIDDVFADWILANYIDDPYVAAGQYYYQGLNLPAEIYADPVDLYNGGRVYTDMVNQYGADYLLFAEPGTYQLTFDGSDAATLMDVEPHSADWMWWSYNLSSSAARLTGDFDLTGLESVTLEFSAWWQTEMDNDWFQVLVSDNAGADWQIVTGQRAIRQGPHAPGAYYSGRSQMWIDEQIDLSDYAGGPLQIRFEYLTDGTITDQGVTLDDIRIAELDYADDVENVFSRWEPEGFMRISNTVTQSWTLALVLDAGEGSATVQPVTLDAANTGRAEFTVPEGGSVTLVIGAMAPFTNARGQYKLGVQRR